MSKLDEIEAVFDVSDELIARDHAMPSADVDMLEEARLLCRAVRQLGAAVHDLMRHRKEIHLDDDILELINEQIE